MGTERILQIIIKAKDQATEVMEKVSGQVSNSMSGVRAAMGAVGLMAAGYLKGAVESAANAEKVNANLEQTIKSTGGAAGMTSKELGNLATALSKTTLFTGGQIKSGEAMLLTFTNIGKNVFPQATQAMLDMSQKMGTGPEQTAIQLGKALNDPIKGITALTRVGVSFTEQQKEQIKSMVEAGNTAGAQKLIIEELNKEFGGQATAAANTYDGQMQQIKKTLGGVKTAIGTELLPYLGILVTKLREGADTVANFVKEHKHLVAGILSVTAVLGTLIGGAGLLQKIMGIMGPVVSGLGTVIGGLTWPIMLIIGAIALLAVAWAKDWGGIREKTMPIITAIKDFIVTSFNAVVAWFKDNWPIIKATFEAVLQGVESVYNDILKPVLGFIIQEFGQVVGWVKDNWPLIRDTITTILSAVKVVVSAVLGWIVDFWKAHGDTIITNLKYYWDIIKTVVDTVIHVVLDIIQFVMNLITGHWGDAWNNLVDAVKRIFSGVGRIIGDILGALGNTFADIAKTAITWGENLIGGFINGIKNVAHKVGDAVHDVIKGVANFLGFNSPAKEGEGQHIVEWGSNMIGGFMDGIRTQLPNLQALMSSAIKTPTLHTNVLGNAAWVGESEKSKAVAPLDKLHDAIKMAVGERGPVLQISMAGLYQGANLSVRSDDDIYRLGIETAKQTWIRAQAAGAGRGQNS